MKKSVFILISICLPMFMIAQPLNNFLGQWSLNIEGGFVGWLDVKQVDGYLDAELLWKWGSVEPVSSIFFTDENTLVVTRSKNIVRKPNQKSKVPRTHILTDFALISIKNGELKGTFTEPKLDGLGAVETSFTGFKLPDMPRAPILNMVRYGSPVVLFNGKDLSGWKLTNPESINGFKIINGVLLNDPDPKMGSKKYGNLQTEKVFEDFRLTLEVNIPNHSNSGVYLRGIYEIQILDSYGEEPDSHNMGAVYSRVTPSFSAEKPAGEWQYLDMILCQRHITVVLNGQTIIDNQPVYGPTGGALSPDVLSPGPIYLQGNHGKVSFRNIVLTPIID